MKYLVYLNILFGDNHCKTVEIAKKGDHLGIKNMFEKIPVH
jgi:hypothetical protein